MNLTNLHRWHWMLIGIVTGLIVGALRYHYTDAEPSGFGSMTQVEFERAVEGTRQAQRTGDPPPILGPVKVIRLPDPRRKGEMTYAVTLLHFGGSRREVSRRDDGTFDMKYRPKIFLAPTPYVSPNLPAGAASGEGPGWLARTAEVFRIKQADPPGTVLDYLQSVRKTHGVQYEYKWWQQLRARLAIWMSASFVVIGLIWPTVINLIAFGSLRRPPEEEGIDLSKVHDTLAGTAHTPPGEADMAATQQMADQLEKQLAAGAGGGTPRPATPAAPAPPVPAVLAGGPVEPATPTQAQESTEFGKDADDFYPTERHHPHEHPHDDPHGS